MTKRLILSGLLILASSCQTPLPFLPGGKLAGEVGTAEDFAFARQYTILQLETCPDDPYSVNLRVTVIDDELIIDAGKRRWHECIKQDPRVRVRLGGTIYEAVAREVTDPDITSRFIAGRTIYALAPR